MQSKVCDFVPDCPEEFDEKTCPQYQVFDECNSLKDCYWTEEVSDDLDFVIMPIIEINEGDYLHGPHTDPINSTDGKVVFLLNEEPDVLNYSEYNAAMLGPVYHNSQSSCVFEFWYYIAGDIGKNGFLSAILINKGEEILLDKLTPDSEGVGQWHKSKNGIGRQRENFNIKIALQPKATFDAGNVYHGGPKWLKFQPKMPRLDTMRYWYLGIYPS